MWCPVAPAYLRGMRACPIVRKEVPALARPAGMQILLLARPTEMKAGLLARPAEMQAERLARPAEMPTQLPARFAQVAMPARSLHLHSRPRMQDS
jgi:hypothetical protein